MSNVVDIQNQAFLFLNDDPESRPAPPWFEPVMNDVEKLMQLKANWNSYGALPLKGRHVARLLSILARVMGNSTPIPSITPTAAGGVSAEWRINDVELQITVEADDGLLDVIYATRLPYERITDLRSWILLFEGGEQ